MCMMTCSLCINTSKGSQPFLSSNDFSNLCSQCLHFSLVIWSLSSIDYPGMAYSLKISDSMHTRGKFSVTFSHRVTRVGNSLSFTSRTACHLLKKYDVHLLLFCLERNSFLVCLLFVFPWVFVTLFFFVLANKKYARMGGNSSPFSSDQDWTPSPFLLHFFQLWTTTYVIIALVQVALNSLGKPLLLTWNLLSLFPGTSAGFSKVCIAPNCFVSGPKFTLWFLISFPLHLGSDSLLFWHLVRFWVSINELFVFNHTVLIWAPSRSRSWDEGWCAGSACGRRPLPGWWRGAGRSIGARSPVGSSAQPYTCPLRLHEERTSWVRHLATCSWDRLVSLHFGPSRGWA